jgi:hypothetical protein
VYPALWGQQAPKAHLGLRARPDLKGYKGPQGLPVHKGLQGLRERKGLQGLRERKGPARSQPGPSMAMRE